MDFPKPNISVKNLLKLLNLLRGCKSTSYKSKTLNNLNRFNKLPYFLKNVNLILLRVLRVNFLKINKLTLLNSSTLFWSQFQKTTYRK